MAQAVPSVAAPRSPSPLDGGVDCLTFPDDGDDVGVYSHFPSARCHGEREGYSSRGCQRCDKHHPSPLKQDEAETERAAEPVTAEPPFSLSPASPSTVYRPVTIDGHTKEGNVVEFYAAAVFVTNPSYFDNLNYRNSSTLRPPTGNQWSPQGIHAKRLGSPATGNRTRTQSLQRHGSRRGPFNIGGMVNQASHSRNGGRPATQPSSRGASRGHSSSAPRVTPVQRGMAVLQYYTAKQELDAHLQLSDGDANDSNPTEDEDFYHAHGDLPSFVRSRSHHGPRLQVASPPLSRPSPHDDSTAATELLSNTGLGDTQEFNVMLKNGLASPELPGSRPTQSNLFRLSRPPPVPQQQVHASRVPGASPLDTRALGLSDSQMSSSLEMEDTGIANDSRLEVVDLPGGGQWKLSSPIYQLSSLPRRPLIPSPPQQGLQKGSMVLTDGEGSPYRRLSRCTLKPSSRHSACAADSGVLPQWPPLQSDAPDGAAARLEAVLSREEKVYLLRREVRMFEREYCVNRGYPIATPKLDTIMSSIVAEHFAGRKEELDGAIGRPGKKEEEHRPLLDHAIRQCVQEAQERRAPAAAAVRATGSPAVEKNYALSGALVSLTAPPTGMTQGSSSTCRPQSGRLGAKSRDGGPGAGRAGSPAPALTGLGHLRPREVMRLVEEQQKAEKARQEEQRKADLLTEQIYGALDRLQVAHALPRSAAAAATTSARKDGDLEETAPPTLGVTTRSLSATNAQASTTAGAGATLAGTTRSSSPKTQSMTPTSPVSPQKHASPFEVLGHGRLDLHAVGGVPLAKSFSLQLDATTNGRPLSPSHKSVPARELSSSSQEPPRHPNNNPDIISPEESCRQLLFSSQLVLNSHSLPFGGPGPRVAAAETARRRAAGDEFARPATKDAPPLLSGNTTTLFAPTVGSSSSGGAGAPGRIGISHSPSDAALPVPLSVPGISPSAGLTSSTETPMAQAGLDAAATSAAHARASFPDRLARSLRLHEPLHHCVRCAARLVVFTLMRTLPKPLYEGDSVDFDVLIQEEERCATEALQWEVERQAERWEAEQRRLAKAARSPAEPNPSPFPSSPQETCSPLARAATTPSVRPTPSGPSEATSPSCMAARVKGFEDRDTMSESSLPVSPTAAALRTERSTSEVEASGRASSAELLRHARAHKRDGELTPDESYGAYTDCSETERLRRRLHRPNYRGSLRSIGDDDLAGSSGMSSSQIALEALTSSLTKQPAEASSTSAGAFPPVPRPPTSSVTDMPSKGSASRAAHRPVVSVLKAARKEEEAVGEELERTFADAANHSIPIFMMRSNAAAYTSLLSLFQTARGRHAPMGAFGANAGGPPQGDPESHARVLRQVGDLLQRSRDSNARLTQEERDVLQSFLEESRHATENSAVAPTTDLLASIVREKSELPPQTDRFGRPTSLGALLTMTHGGFGVAPFSGDMYNYLLQHRELEDCLLHGGPTDGAPMTDLERRAAVVRHIIEPEPALLPLVTLMNVLRTCTSSNVVLPYHQAELLLGPIELRLLLDVMRSFAALSFSLSQEEDGAGVAKGAGKEEFGAFFYRIHREELLEWSCVVICEAAVGYAMSLAGEGVAGFPLVSYASTSTLTEEQVDAVLESELPAKSLPNVPFSKFNRQVAYSVVEKNRSVVLEALVRLKGELYYLLTGVDECSRLLDMHQRLLEQVRASSLKEQKIRSSAMAKNQTQARVLKHSGGACAGGGGRSGRAGSSRGASIRPAHKRSFRLDHSHHTSTPLTHGGVGDERTNTSGPQRGRCSTKTSPTTRRMTSRLTSHQPSRQASVPPSRRGSGRLRSVAVPASETSMSCTPSHHPDSANRGGAAELTFVELIDTEATTASPVKAVPPTASTNNSRAGGNTSVGGGSKKRQRGLACNPLQTVFLSLPGNVSTTSLLAHSATAPPQAGSLSRRGSLQTDKPAGTTAPVAKGNAPPTVGVPRGGHGGPQLSMEGTAPPAVEANLPVLGSADFSTSRGGVGSSAVAGIYKPPMAITRGSNHTSSIMEGEGANGRATTICPQHQRGESRGSSGIFSMTPSSPLGHGRGAAAEAGGEESGGTEDGGAARTKQQRRHVRTALSVLPSRLGIHTVLQDMQELENERASNNRTNPLLTGAIYEHGGAMAVEHILPSTTPAQGGDDAVDEAEDVAAGLMPNSFRSQRSATRNALKSVWEPTSYIPSAIPSKATHKKSGTGDGGGAKSGGRSPSSPSGQKGVEPNKAGMHCPTHLLRKYSTFVLEEDEGVMASEQPPTTEDEEASGTPTQRRKPGDEDEEIFEVIIGANEAEHCEEAAEVERIRQWLMRHGGVVDATATTGETEMPLLPDAMGSSLVDRPGSPSPHTTTLPPPPFQATHPSNNPEKRLRNVKPTAWYAHGKPSFERHRLESKLQRLRPKGLFDLNSISPLIALNACINTDGMDEEDRRASATFLGTGHLAQRKSSVAARSPLEAEFRANPFVRSSTAGHRRPPARAHLVRRSSPLAGSTTSRPSSSMSATTIKRAVVPTAAQQAQRVCLRERGLRMGQQLMPWTIK